MTWFYFGLLSMCGYGIGPLLAKRLTERVNPLQGVFLTNLAVVATCAIAAATQERLIAPVPFAWGILILGGLTGAIAILSLFKGIEAGQVAVVAPVANSFPIVTWVLSLLFLSLPFSPLSFLGTLVVVFGVVTLAYQPQTGFHWNRSALYGVITALGWGAHAFFIFLLMNTGLGPFTTGFYLEGTILIWLTIFLAYRRSLNRSMLQYMWPYGLFCGVVTALGALGYTLAVAAGGHPEMVATIVGANPVLTCLLVLPLFHERLNLRQGTGVAVTFAGLLALRLIAFL